jgi:sphinganine-1-phosphate aldolase
VGTFLDTYASIRRTLYGWFLRAPGVRSQVEKQVSEAIMKLQTKLVPSGPGVVRYLNLPKEGWSEEMVRNEVERLATMDHTRWEDGFVSGAVYHGGESLIKLQTEAYGKFTVANPIHPDVFPGVRKMEAEIVAMVLAMFNAPVGGAGVTTSGGTESILMACLSARQKAYAERGVTEPEMYVSWSSYHLSMADPILLGSSQRLHILLSAKQGSILASRSTLWPAQRLHTKYIFQASPA